MTFNNYNIIYNKNNYNKTINCTKPTNPPTHQPTQSNLSKTPAGNSHTGYSPPVQQNKDESTKLR